MGSLFSRRTPESRSLINSNPAQQTPTTNPDAISYVENMLQRSGGDAKAAFYLAAKEKGIDPDQFLKQISTMGNTKSMVQNMLSRDPRIGRLMSLFSLMK